MRHILAGAALAVLLLIALALALAWAPDRPVDDLKARWATPPSVFVPLQGMSVHLRDEGVAGDELPIVLLHGTSASLHTWDGWVDALAPTRRVIRVDLPGFGLTGPFPHDDYHVTRYVAFVLELLDSLEIPERDRRRQLVRRAARVGARRHRAGARRCAGPHRRGRLPDGAGVHPDRLPHRPYPFPAARGRPPAAAAHGRGERARRVRRPGAGDRRTCGPLLRAGAARGQPPRPRAAPRAGRQPRSARGAHRHPHAADPRPLGRQGPAHSAWHGGPLRAGHRRQPAGDLRGAGARAARGRPPRHRGGRPGLSRRVAGSDEFRARDDGHRRRRGHFPARAPGPPRLDLSRPRVLRGGEGSRVPHRLAARLSQQRRAECGRLPHAGFARRAARHRARGRRPAAQLLQCVPAPRGAPAGRRAGSLRQAYRLPVSPLDLCARWRPRRRAAPRRLPGPGDA
jgi:pimeloyl-ACP methyl ester carboxylesterase